MSIEQKVNNILQKTPVVKKIIKRTYQLAMYTISPKIKSQGDIVRINPDDGYEYFFGYYDKSPWDVTGRFMLALRTAITYKEVAPKRPAEIILIDTEHDETIKLSETKAWNVQQGAMLQWLGPDFSQEILFNDFRDGRYVSVVFNIDTKEERILSKPVYSVAENGEFALSLNFSRLHRLRPGYGYSWLEDATLNQSVPDEAAIWKIDLKSGKVKPIATYNDFVSFEYREEMKDAEHKVNHIMLNPSAKRFMVLHRWLKNGKKYTRLITMNHDGSDWYNLSDEDMTSHSYWKNDEEIISYLRKKDIGNGYFLLKDQSEIYKQVLTSLKSVGDGHPSFSPDGTKLVTDTYADRTRMQRVYVSKVKQDNFSEPQEVAKVFAPFRYDNDVRCDLHPRWNRKGTKVCIDATFEGKRGLYVVNIS